ncbi:MAG: hypothetical protein GX620_03850 [Chloroflexi bacterium]|nr:hypothetical protein [Chloroflexota bacterium]
MSGVFGFIDSQKQILSDHILRMSRRLRQSEWTRIQTWSDDQSGAALGQVNIGLFSTDVQPFCSEDGAVAVVFFGELYHVEGLRARLAADSRPLRLGTEAELVLRLYETLGAGFIRDLEGVFVLAIWDGRQGQLLVANDRFGLVPLYYAHYDGKLVFAPTVGAILTDRRLKRELDLTAMAQFIRFQRLLGDRTFFDGVHLLPYASQLRYDQSGDTVNVAHYWDFDQIPAWPEKATFEDAVVESGRLLRRAVEARTRGDFRAGVYLSGGLDSRTLLGIASQIASPVVSLTYGVPGCRDVLYAERIAKRLKSPHYVFPLTDGSWVQDEVSFHLEVTEGFVTWTHCHAATTLRPARDLMDVNLTGFYGDQLLGARASSRARSTLGAIDDMDFVARMYEHFVRDFSWPGLTEAEEKLLFSQEFYPRIRDQAFDSLAQGLAAFCCGDNGHRLEYITSVYHCTRLTNMNCVYQRAFFEARYPFCDYQLVDWVYSMPIDYRLDDRLYLGVINREVPRVTWVPRDADEQLLTDHKIVREVQGMLQRARRRLTGLDHRAIHEDPEGWLRRDLGAWAEDLLFAPRTLERGFYNPVFLRSLFDRQMSGREVDTIGKIAPIMTYEMMLRRLYD